MLDKEHEKPSVAHYTDPRVQMAAERTYLAWVRTGLAMKAFGFVVARFAVFLETLGQNANGHSPFYPTMIGVGLVLLGIITDVTAIFEYTRYCRTVADESKISHSSWLFAMFSTIVLAFLGIAIAIYLLMSVSG